MINIFNASVCKPLELMFTSCLENGKKTNVVLAHKKGDKRNLKNYRPISLLPVAGKIFEEYRIIACMDSLQKIT